MNPQENKFSIVNFSERFSDLLSNSGLSQKHFAATLGLAESAIVNYKSGRIPKASELLRIARYFHVTMEWLLTGDEPKHPVFALQKNGFFLAYFSCYETADDSGDYQSTSGDGPENTLLRRVGMAKFEFLPPDHPCAIPRAEQHRFYERYINASEEEKRSMLSLGKGSEKFFTSRGLNAFGVLMKRHLDTTK